MSRLGPSLALGILASLACAPRALAQRVEPLPVLNARFDLPIGLVAEAGVLFNTLRSEGIAGGAIVVAAGQHGGRAGAGYRLTAMMGLQLMANAYFARTWGNPIGVPPGQSYLGADARMGILFTSVGAGVLARVGGRGDRGGPPVRLTASIGIGL